MNKPASFADLCDEVRFALDEPAKAQPTGVDSALAAFVARVRAYGLRATQRRKLFRPLRASKRFYRNKIAASFR